MNVTYDPNVDYKKLMDEAIARGDLTQAAIYEEKRNAKIRGQGLTQYSQTKEYAKYLPQTTQKQMEEVLAKLENREPFSYDISTDKLYDRYVHHYRKTAKSAMEEANAQAALLTGGYGNSYGLTLGQQAYEGEMDKLLDRASELRDTARKEYDAQGEALEEQYERLSKELSARRESAEKLAKQEEQAKEQAKEQAEKKAQTETDKAYNLVLAMLKSGVYPSDELLGSSGISQKDAQAMYEAYKKEMIAEENGSTTGSGGSSSGSGGSSSGKTSSTGKTNSTGKTSSGGKTGSGTQSGSGSKTDSGSGGKALSNTLWSQLQKAYESGSKAGDLSAFHRNRSSLKAQGYDVSAFDAWAKTAYGLSYESGDPKTVDMQNVLSLGYGPLSEARLKELVKAGVLEEYTYGDLIRYRKKGNSYVKNPTTRLLQ